MIKNKAVPHFNTRSMNRESLSLTVTGPGRKHHMSNQDKGPHQLNEKPRDSS